MSRRLNLEDFATDGAGQSGPAGPGHSSASSSLAAIERVRLEGYEKGYKEGWDDAARSELEEQGRIGVEFARNLQDLGFTFQEARSHVLHALEPLLAAMVEKVLPDLVSQTVGQSVLDELMPLAAEAADTPVEIVAGPDSLALIEPMLSAAKGIPFRLVSEPTLAEGQVYLRSGENEKHLDFPRAVDRIGNAIKGLYELNERAFQNGQ